jgi:ribosomal protein S18 acetylase RimI-like enzyme
MCKQGKQMKYIDNIDKITSSQLHGFFVGWKSPLTPERHYELLRRSTHFIVALDGEKAVGFITALSDGVNSSFIPLLEVLPEYQARGIGSELLRRMLIKLDDIANVDLTCDPDMQPFYERFKMLRSSGMILRKYK